MEGEAGEVAAARVGAELAFAGLLDELVAELPLLRAPLGASPPPVRGPVARRMVRAVWPHRAVFVTPMAAVAGAVADYVLAALVRGRELRRAWVNDGGDVALHLGPGTSLRLGAVADVRAGTLDGRLTVEAREPVRGVATSGRGGRSFSLGVADAVTVLAADAAAADAAATLIANAVDVRHPAVRREPASSLDPDSDLGDRLVTVDVGTLEPEAVAAALDRGALEALRQRRAGLIVAAALRLRGAIRTVGPLPALPPCRG